MNTFKNLINTVKEKETIASWILFIAVVCYIIGLYNKALATGFFLIFFLSIITIFIFYKAGVKDKNIYIIFLGALVVHLGAVLFIYYSGFHFGGGADFTGYHQNAVDISYRFKQGNFSLDGLGLINYFPVLIGVVYTFTLPEVIVGNLFTAWIAALSVMLAYLVVLEIDGTKKTALLAGFIITAYPSYLYFGSVLLKDTAVIPLVLGSMLLVIRMLKKFSWSIFLAFFIILTALIHLRFYVGYALMFTFIISWPLISQYHIKKRMAYWLVMVFILGLSPLILGSGYYGSYHYKEFMSSDKITYFREIVYTANSPLNSQPPAPQPPAPQPPMPQLSTPQPPVPQPESPKPVLEGSGSTFIVEAGINHGPVTFLKNSFQSFIYSLLGPFPWQFKNQQQIVGLAETIPWYILIASFFYASTRFIMKNGILPFFKFYKLSLPLLVFSILALGALSLYINNYGIIARIRIPMFICLILLMCVIFDNFLEKYYEKIPHHWRRWIYRLPFIRGAFTQEK